MVILHTEVGCGVCCRAYRKSIIYENMWATCDLAYRAYLV